MEFVISPTNLPTDLVPEAGCVCTGPGTCPLYGREVTAQERALCSCECPPDLVNDPHIFCTPERCATRRRRWFDRYRLGHSVKVKLKSKPPPSQGPPTSPGGRRELSGPGTELKELLKELGIHPRKSCGCAAMEVQMNQWGVEGCEAKRGEILPWLRRKYAETGWLALAKATVAAVASGFAFKVDPRDPADSVLREAIARAKKRRGVVWQCGLTTVPSRRKDLLPRTLASLKAAHFPRPLLFVDGDADPGSWMKEFGTEVVCRPRPLKTAGNWFLTLWELYVRFPWADRYAVFQDDFVTYRNLREYLEQVPYPDKGYLNLYTFPENVAPRPKRSFAGVPKAANGDPLVGFYPSNQLGKGAVALVFDNAAATTLLGSRYMADRFKSWERGWRAVDGGIVEALRKEGFTEYVHFPSLVQHTGDESAMGNQPHERANTFRGEGFDALELLPKDG